MGVGVALMEVRVISKQQRAVTAEERSDGAMQTTTSRDGTPIAVWRSGAGPALLLVHGMVAGHSTTWRLALPELERRFTVYTMDRRGRGGSGDTSGYSLLREAEDVAAVVDSIGESVNLLRHSYGGLCALEACLLTSHVRRLVLYEGVSFGGSRVRAEAIEELQALLVARDVDGMLSTFLIEMAGACSEQMRSTGATFAPSSTRKHAMAATSRTMASCAFPPASPSASSETRGSFRRTSRLERGMTGARYPERSAQVAPKKPVHQCASLTGSGPCRERSAHLGNIRRRVSP